ncbi:MAG: sulfatase-like hydrolase/transferase [Verrucomicrobiae bacterium]|nr:sulfatase-like hydrolase/transferase [Verrucomicrobiae bacterium]
MKNPLSSAFVLLFVCALSSVGAIPEKPNILMIFADDVGREVLECYGGSSYRTPNINALSEGGMKFTHAYAMPVCHPSRITLLTGQYPARLGNPAWGDFPKQAADRTIAATLKKAGYTTAIAGKWQLALLKKNPDHPKEVGFDRFSVFGWHEGPRYHDPMIYQDGEVREDTKGKYGPDLYSQYLIDFMKESRDSGTPFFALYSMALCHDVTDDIGHPVPFYKDGKWMSYPEMAASMDEMVGRMTKALDELGLRENTLVIFTTDNGTAAATYITVAPDGKFVREPNYSEFEGEQIRGGKGTFVDWGTRVPLIANLPGVIEGGQVTEDLVDLSDYLPTFAEVAGAPLPEEVKLDGHSFAGRLFRDETNDREWAYVELKGKFFAKTRDYKLYGNGNFFDLTKDPLEEGEPLQGELTAEQKAGKEKLATALASVPEPVTEPSFQSIFNGKDLTGWEGLPGAWEVRDGAIHCTGKAEGKNWLIWKGGEPSDFELRLEFRFVSGNSGVQVRSHLLEGDTPFLVQGYQVEIAEADKMGLWHHSLAPDKSRSHLATAGQLVVIGKDGQRKTEKSFAEPTAVQSNCRDGEWNELVVTAKGNRLVQKINGVKFAELTDQDANYAMSQGLIALQDHGKGTVADFRKIRLKILK